MSNPSSDPDRDPSVVPTPRAGDDMQYSSGWMPLLCILIPLLGVLIYGILR
jgi:hypothetical protein